MTILRFATLLLVICSPPIFAQTDVNGTVKIRVSILVSAKGQIADVIKGYVDRELRKINDIEIVAKNPDINIECDSTEIATQNGIVGGYAIAFSVTSQRANKIGKFILDKNKSNELYSILYPLFNTNGSLIDHLLIVTSSNQLESTVAFEIASIDSRDFDKYRPKN